MPLPPQTVLRRYRVADNRRLADGVFQLLLEPVDNPLPPFQAGQWVYLHLLNPDNSVWAKAAYSLANAPSVPGPVELAIKLEGDFTKRAQTLRPGDEVLLQGPWGIFMLKRDEPRLVIFAGGIGITPFISMIREAQATDLAADIILFYSNRTCGEAAYAKELADLARRYSHLKLVEICTREAHSEDGRETRRIDAALLDKYLVDYGVGEYLMCGPREFMDELAQILQNKGVERKQIRRELFA